MSFLDDPKRAALDTTDVDAGDADALPLDHGTDMLRHLIGLEDGEEKVQQPAPVIPSVSGHRQYGGGGLGVGTDNNSISINNASSSQLAVTPSPMAEAALAARSMGDRFGQQALQHANATMSVTVGHMQHPQQQHSAQGAHNGNGAGQQGLTQGQRQGSGLIATPLARLGSGSLLTGGDGSGSERFSLHLQGGVPSNATTPHHATMLMYQQQHGLAVGAFPSAGIGFGAGGGGGHTAAVPNYSTLPAGPTYQQNVSHYCADNYTTQNSTSPSVPTVGLSPNLNAQTNSTAAPPYYHQSGSVTIQGIPLTHIPPAAPSAHFMSVPGPLVSSSAAQHTAALQQSSVSEQQQVGATFTSEEGCDNLFIANISNDVDDELLTNTFEPFGDILSAKVMLDIHTGRSRGFGFVMYTSESSGAAAMRALHNTPLGERGQRMSVTKAQTSGRSAITETTKLYVRNVPVHLQEQALREHFAQYGVIRRFARKEDTASKNDASKQALKQSLPPSIVIFLEYATVKEARHAVKAIHGKKPWSGMVIPLLAKTAETTENRNVRRERQRQKVDEKRSQPTEDSGLNGVFLATGTQPAIGGLPYLQQSQSIAMDPSPLYINSNVAVGYSTSVGHVGLGIEGMTINVNNGQQQQQQQPSVAAGNVGVAQNVNFHSNPMANGRPQIDLNAMYSGAGTSLAHLSPHAHTNNNNNGNVSTMTNYSPSHTQSFAPSPTNAATPFHMGGNNASGFMSFGVLNTDGFGSGPSHMPNIGASPQQAHHSTTLNVHGGGNGHQHNHQQQGGGPYMYPSTTPQQMPYVVGTSSQQIDTSQHLGGLASPSIACGGGGGGNDSSMHITVGSTPPLLTPTNAQQHQHQHYQQQRLGSGGGGGNGGYFYQQQQLSSPHTVDSLQTGMNGMAGFSGAMGTMGGMAYDNKLTNTNGHTTSGGMLHLAPPPISSTSAPAPPRYSPTSTPTNASGQQVLHQQLRHNQFQYQSQQQVHLQQQAYQQQQQHQQRQQQQVPPSYGETVSAGGAFSR